MSRYISNVLKKPSMLALIGVGLILAACSTAPADPGEVTTEPSPDAVKPRYASIASVAVSDGDKRPDIEAEYGGKVILHKPKSGFAIVAYDEAETDGQVGTQKGRPTKAKIEPNVDTFASPEVDATGFHAWSSGFHAWSSGFHAWSSGFHAWSSGDEAPTPPLGNQGVWDQIRLNEAYRLSSTLGEGVTVAVIDTGLDLAHPMFEQRLAPSRTWIDFVDGDKTPQDEPGGDSYGHGTAVAGVISQVAPKALIMPIRVLEPDGKGDLSSVVLAIDHAISMGADIINLSLGTGEQSDSLLNLLSYARNSGVYVIASAGNNGELNNLLYPSRYAWWTQVHPYVMSVSSVGSDNLLSDFSAYGDNLMIAAPGENLLTAFPDGQLSYATGTSFASPLLTGALALALNEVSDADRDKLFDYASKSVCCGEIWENNRNLKGTDRIGQGILDIPNLLRELPGFVEPGDPFVSSQNLVANPGFEAASLGGWDSANAWISSQRVSGTYGTTLGYGEAWISQWIGGLEPNTSYTLTAWVDRPANGDLVNLTVDKYLNGSSHHWMSIWTTQDGFVSRSITFTTGANDSTARITLWKNGSGEVQVDHFSLVKNAY